MRALLHHQFRCSVSSRVWFPGLDLLVLLFHTQPLLPRPSACQCSCSPSACRTAQTDTALVSGQGQSSCQPRHQDGGGRQTLPGGDRNLRTGSPGTSRGRQLGLLSGHADLAGCPKPTAVPGAQPSTARYPSGKSMLPSAAQPGSWAGNSHAAQRCCPIPLGQPLPVLPCCPTRGKPPPAPCAW